jgi:hypothetical protein
VKRAGIGPKGSLPAYKFLNTYVFYYFLLKLTTLFFLANFDGRQNKQEI